MMAIWIDYHIDFFHNILFESKKVYYKLKFTYSVKNK